MCNISLSMSRGANSTVISNHFIDELMPEANGSYVKVYIYLLRLMSDSSELSLQILAERLDETEKDIRRALKYWEDKGILTVKYNSLGEVTDIVFLNPDTGSPKEKSADIIRIFDDSSLDKISQGSAADYSAPAKSAEAQPDSEKPAVIEKRPMYSPKQISLIMDTPEMRTLVRKVSERIGRPLSQNDSQLVMFLFECLQFSPDLIYHLYDYCFERGKANSAYIEKVALNWAQNGIRSVDDANEKNVQFEEQIRTVCKAFGFNRPPAEAEKTFIRRWFSDFGFSTDMVREACDRTVIATNKPDFRYTDKILVTWNQLGIHSLADLNSHDENWKTTKRSKKSSSSSSSSSGQGAAAASAPSTNKFNSFPQRSYSSEELASLEKLLMNK